ncbi:hypothetical protein [Nocardioides sp. WS12]|uniref:hypothetical protein n=1 Tax=Nocardioides sp. WS12 TaxID=2486272 RepID=UPI001F3B0D0D|nr:hypothetical protein [Nocardioides sp. WS12]
MFDVQPGDEVARVYSERLCESKQALEGDVSVTALNAGNERPMQRAAFGKRLKGLPLGLADCPDAVAELDSRVFELIVVGVCSAGHALTPSG